MPEIPCDARGFGLWDTPLTCTLPSGHGGRHVDPVGMRWESAVVSLPGGTVVASPLPPPGRPPGAAYGPRKGQREGNPAPTLPNASQALSELQDALAGACPCICHDPHGPVGHIRPCCIDWNGPLHGEAGRAQPLIEARARRDAAEEIAAVEARAERDTEAAARRIAHLEQRIAHLETPTKETP